MNDIEEHMIMNVYVDFMTLKRFLCYWPRMPGIHRWTIDSPIQKAYDAEDTLKVFFAVISLIRINHRKSTVEFMVMHSEKGSGRKFQRKNFRRSMWYLPCMIPVQFICFYVKMKKISADVADWWVFKVDPTKK